MHDSFEFRDDFHRANSAAGCPIMLCPVKWQAAKRAIELARSDPAMERLFSQVGLTADFEPSEVRIDAQENIP